LPVEVSQGRCGVDVTEAELVEHQPDVGTLKKMARAFVERFGPDNPAPLVMLYFARGVLMLPEAPDPYFVQRGYRDYKRMRAPMGAIHAAWKSLHGERATGWWLLAASVTHSVAELAAVPDAELLRWPGVTARVVERWREWVRSVAAGGVE
jgi:hypothetical protein